MDQHRRLGTLEQVDLRTYWVDEARDFTPWLAEEENIRLLGETIGLDLDLEAVEVRVGTFKADILAKDVGSDDNVLIENQLERTNHDHLGKLITYASGLDAKTVVWVAREISEDHRNAIDWLNEVTTDAVGFFALEVELWRIADSPPAPKFNLVSQPNEWAKSLSASGTSREPTETKLLQLNFWKAFVEHCRQSGLTLNLRKSLPQHWYTFAIGRSRFTISLTVNTMKKRVGCEIYIRAPVAERAFEALEMQKEEIEDQLGELDWMALPHRSASRIVQYRQGDVQNQHEWPELHRWLRERAESFHSVFSPRIRALDLEEDEGDEEEEPQPEHFPVSPT